MKSSSTRSIAIVAVAFAAIITSACGSTASGGGSAASNSASESASQTGSGSTSEVSGSSSSAETSDNGGSSSSKPLIKVSESGFNVMSMAPIYIAIQKGFFKDEGLDFTFQEISSGKLGVSTLLSGDTEFTDLGFDDIVNLHGKGKDLMAVYNLENAVTMDLVIRKEVVAKLGVDPTSPIEDRMKALKGLTFGITSPGAPTEYFPKYMLTSVGMNPDKDANFVAVGSATALVAAFKSGQIDGFMLSPPTPYLLESQGIGTILIKGKDVPKLNNDAFTTVAVLASYAEEHPEVIEAYARAVSRGAKWMVNNQEEAAQILHDNYFKDTDMDTLRLSVKLSVESSNKTGKLTEQAVSNQIEILTQAGQIDTKADTSEGVLWTNKFSIK